MPRKILVKPWWILSDNWKFVASGHVLATIGTPWTQPILNFGRAQLQVGKEVYELTLPHFMGGPGVYREAPIKLFKGEHEIARLTYPKLETNEEMVLQWGDRQFQIRMEKAQTWQCVEENSICAEVRIQGFLSRTRVITLHDPTIELAVAATIFWSTIHRIS